MAIIQVKIGDTMENGYFFNTSCDAVISEVRKFKCPVRLFDYLEKCDDVEELQHNVDSADIVINLEDEKKEIEGFMTKNYIISADAYISKTNTQVDRYGNRI